MYVYGGSGAALDLAAELFGLARHAGFSGALGNALDLRGCVSRVPAVPAKANRQAPQRRLNSYC